MDPLLAKLQGTDRRSIGRSEEVVGDVLADPGQFHLLFDAMLARDPVVRMRAADAVEKLTRRRPDLLRGLEGRLLTEVAAIDQKEVRWHVAQLLPRLALTHRSEGRRSPSSWAFLTMTAGSCGPSPCRPWPTWPKLMRGCVAGSCRCWRELTRSGTPAMRSRGHKLVARLQRADR